MNKFLEFVVIGFAVFLILIGHYFVSYLQQNKIEIEGVDFPRQAKNFVSFLI